MRFYEAREQVFASREELFQEREVMFAENEVPDRHHRDIRIGSPGAQGTGDPVLDGRRLMSGRRILGRRLVGCSDSSISPSWPAGRSPSWE
jgi:hypothetical protein